MNQNKGVLIGTIAILVIAALLIWWIVARQPFSTMSDITQGTAATPEGTTKPASAGTTGAVVTKVNRSTQTVNAIVAGLSGTSQFNALFNSTGVAASIKSTGKYTIFVPTNGSISQLPSGTISNMTAAQKVRLIQYHVVAGRAVDVDAELAGTIQALSGDELNFSYGINKIPMVNSAIVITEYSGKNGTVYLIDNVLLPPKKANL